MQNSATAFFSMLLNQAPSIVAYVVALLLCILWRNRCPRAATLALIGTVMLFLTAVIFPMVQMYLVANRGNNSIGSLGQMLVGLSLVASLLRGAGFILLFAAVFSERPRVETSAGFPMAQVHSSPQMRV